MKKKEKIKDELEEISNKNYNNLNGMEGKMETKRTTSDELEEILNKEFKVLDKGFVRVIDYMGDDSSICEAARVSYGKGTKKKSEDEKLINYLMKYHHTTPFEMCEIKLHVKLPIFVARQWVRHRTANINEYSARYSIMNKEFYIPKKENLGGENKLNKQGRENLSMENGEFILNLLKNDSEECFKHYEEMINLKNDFGETIGLARELARINLPVNFYTEWYWKIDLHNLLHFLKLRSSDHAQFEIREYASTILHEILKRWVPVTYSAFFNYIKNSENLSGKAVEILKKKINKEDISEHKSEFGSAEWNDLMIFFNKIF